ncbi:hypothetical protein M2302_002503 [Micromonospora sp. A200]|uniref:hypothetical protein n=1 Tax=Micromonospora sp. A200 TaxID=2940568 RepID=UPI00247359EC|nr:hypothetical protein [Micromonospora sp. A200]MDH6462325.1 hypothetical protein [Micromonospora sp. A200]
MRVDPVGRFRRQRFPTETPPPADVAVDQHPAQACVRIAVTDLPPADIQLDQTFLQQILSPLPVTDEQRGELQVTGPRFRDELA